MLRLPHRGHWSLWDKDGHASTFRVDGCATVRDHTGIGCDSRTDVFQGRRKYVWNNDQDAATLHNDRGRFVGDASWDRHHRDGGNHHGGRPALLTRVREP
ncbi:hypothetical protein [Streptomyces sp. NPDC058964]|uniref:hypothetical protein n=1 Tax=Streptomyces sp. NPDC058964 TaxID=3346681 RepID=UPI00368DFAD3